MAEEIKKIDDNTVETITETVIRENKIYLLKIKEHLEKELSKVNAKLEVLETNLIT